MSMTLQEEKKAKLAFYISSIAFGSTHGLNTVLSLFISKFSEYPMTTVYQMTTLPSLFTLIVSLFAGFIIGRKISYRNSFIFATIVYTTAGVLPFFFHENLYFIIACVVVTRIGMTIFNFKSAAIAFGFSGAKTGQIIAWCSTIASITIVIVTKVAGWLGTFGAHYVFVLNFAGIIAFIAIFFLMRQKIYITVPQKSDNNDSNKIESTPKDKMQLSPYLFVALGVFLIFNLTSQYPILYGASQIIAVKGLGDTNVAGTIISAATIGSMLVGPSYKFIEKLFKKYLMAISAALVGVGLLLIVKSNSVALCTLGMILRGYGICVICTLIIPYMSSVTRPQEKSIMSALFMVVNGLCGYIWVYVSTFIGNILFNGDTVIGPNLFGAYVALIVAALLIVIDPRPKAYKEINNIEKKS